MWVLILKENEVSLREKKIRCKKREWTVFGAAHHGLMQGSWHKTGALQETHTLLPCQL